MITRLKVNGFKNLVDIDVRFGPFTCIAGENGVGKSNLFDAIRFLSALADHTFMEAAKSVRDESGRTGDVRVLFHRHGGQVAERLEFEVEMVVPQLGTDDLGQPAEATASFLRYALELSHREEGGETTLELLREQLTDIKKAEAGDCLGFPTSTKWRKSAIKSSTRASPFISTEGSGDHRVIKLHQENRPGRTARHMARKLPRTVLSRTSALESPTALLARQEMQSWRLLQLEPSALRQPDEFSAPARLSPNGAHLPATLYRLGRIDTGGGQNGKAGWVYEQIANRLHDLIHDIREIAIDRDEKRELYTLTAIDWEGTPFPARALSDGTLRFLALAVLELDPEALGVICFEEPENGIHPERIPAMLRLLKDIATDTEYAIGPDNPLRQVIVNTHSPGFFQSVNPDDLVFAEQSEYVGAGRRFRRLALSFPSETWREQAWRSDHDSDPPLTAPGKTFSYRFPATKESEPDYGTDNRRIRNGRAKRMVDRKDFLPLFPDPDQPV